MIGSFRKRRYHVPRKEIGFLRFIFEGYDGLLFLRTLDSSSGLVEISHDPSRQKEAQALLSALGGLPLSEATETDEESG